MMPRRVLAAVAAGALAGIVLVAVGVETWFAVAWALIAAAAVLIGRIVIPADPGSDAPSTALPERRTGSEVSRLAWAVNPRTGEVGALLLRRVQGILRRRLAAHGVDAGDPEQLARVRALCGDDVWEALTRNHATRADVERALTAADRLNALRTAEEKTR